MLLTAEPSLQHPDFFFLEKRKKLVLGAASTIGIPKHGHDFKNLPYWLVAKSLLSEGKKRVKNQYSTTGTVGFSRVC